MYNISKVNRGSRQVWGVRFCHFCAIPDYYTMQLPRGTEVKKKKSKMVKIKIGEIKSKLLSFNLNHSKRIGCCRSQSASMDLRVSSCMWIVKSWTGVDAQ